NVHVRNLFAAPEDVARPAIYTRGRRSRGNIDRTDGYRRTGMARQGSTEVSALSRSLSDRELCAPSATPAVEFLFSFLTEKIGGVSELPPGTKPFLWSAPAVRRTMGQSRRSAIFPLAARNDM